MLRAEERAGSEFLMKRAKRALEVFPDGDRRGVRWLPVLTAVAHLEGLDAGLDDGSKDRFALAGVGKHVRDLVQEAAEDTPV